MIKSRLIKNIVKWSLLLLFISYLGGITLFPHAHIVDGITIVHSHPFDKSSQHSHTEEGFILIHILNHIITSGLGIIPLFSFALIFSGCIILFECITRRYVHSFKGVLSLRAPPVL